MTKLSPEASDLIIKLCEDRRWQARMVLDEIKAHPFFKTIDFSSDLKQQSASYILKSHTQQIHQILILLILTRFLIDNEEENVNDTLNGWYKMEAP